MNPHTGTTTAPRPVRNATITVVSIATLLAASGRSIAIDKSWNTGNGSWATAANWSPSGLPSPADRVFIGNTPAATNASTTMNVNATIGGLTITDGMRLDTGNSQLTVTGDTVVSGQNQLGNNVVASSALVINQGAAATDCSLDNVTISDQGRIDIRDGSTLRVSGLLWLGDGSLSGDGVLNLTSNDPTSLRIDGSLQPSVNGFTINQLGAGTIDLDGLSTGSDLINIASYRINGSGFASLTINGTQLRDPYDDDIYLGGRNELNMNLSDGWTIGPAAVLSIFGNSQYPGPAQINGNTLTFGGRMSFFVAGAHAQFNAPVILAATADIVLTPADRLEFNNSTTIEGGTFSLDQDAVIDFDGPTLVRAGAFSTFSNLESDGAVNFRGSTQWFGDATFTGVARQHGPASVIGASDINADIFDMDGASGNASWTVGSNLTITADRIDTTSVINAFNGDITVGGGFLSRLTVNINSDTNPSWSLSGHMTLSGDANLFLTRLSGSRMFQNGNLTIGGKVQVTADLVFGNPGVNTFVNASSVLRTTGRTNVYAGATFVGQGTLQNTTTGTIDLSHDASLDSAGLQNEGLLTQGTFAQYPGLATVARFTNTPSGRWIVDIGGYTPGAEHDRLDVTVGTAQLAGDLEVNIIDLGLGLFHPQIGDTFTILGSRNGINGAFTPDPVTLSDDHFYHWTVIHGATSVMLRLDDIIPVPCAADFNQDGGIDGADVDAFFAAWGEGDQSADVNFDGGVDGADVAAFFEVWEAGGC